MSTKTQISVFWFRRDLRLEDNAGLFHALKGPHPVLPIFIFDIHILNKLNDRADKRVSFIWQELKNLDQQLREMGSGLQVFYGTPVEAFETISRTYALQAVYTNHDYEPYARQRDHHIAELLAQKGTRLQTYKDTVIFEKDEVVKDDGKPYTVFTPYSRKWRKILSSADYRQFDSEGGLGNLLRFQPEAIPKLEDMGFVFNPPDLPARKVKADIIRHYKDRRDFPALTGTSRLSMYLRFGSISIRQLLSYALDKSDVYVNELIWRDFYHQILWHFPDNASHAFKKEYDRIEWRNDEVLFRAWCNGQTGYPLVDAGMRELNATGFMHNRVRMVTASFLTKHLLIDWRWGEAYFAEKLLDFDLAANNGGWQWAAGCGTDAAPYFRIFNPKAQMERFDKELEYVRKWVPEYGTSTYVKPVVNHEAARKLCLETYQKALKTGA